MTRKREYFKSGFPIQVLSFKFSNKEYESQLVVKQVSHKKWNGQLDQADL